MKRFFILSIAFVLMIVSCKSPVTPEDEGWYITNYTNDNITIIINTESIIIPAWKNHFSKNMKSPSDVKNLDTEKYEYTSSYFYLINEKLYHEFRIVPKNTKS